ncbi:MAG: hypothetical protein KJ065_09835 [Anaerolineae bacterium]|nr:hypothetical protein [Anaerolineae bacterium]
MRKSVIFLLAAGCILLIGLVVQAQTDCAVVVRQALLLVADTCEVTGRNEACYGFLRVDAEARDDVEAFSFEPGDIEDVAKIASLRTYPYDAETGQWGVSLVRLQANLPDLLPGANATFLMFGDAEIRDIPRDNLRPMQAFRLKTGITGTSCQEVPSDGVMIQTPHGVGHVDFNVNRVDVSLGSTLFLQAVPGDKMTLSTIEGSARVTLGGVTRVVLPGFRIEIPLDEDLNPIGSLGLPRPYIMETVETLPIELLDEPVVLRLPGGAEMPPTEDTVACCDGASTPGSGLRPTSTPSANVEADEDGRLGEMAGNSDNVFTGNCGSGQGVGVANGCNDSSTSSSQGNPPPNSNAGGNSGGNSNTQPGSNSDNAGNPPPNSNAGGNSGGSSNAQPGSNSDNAGNPPPNSNAGGNDANNSDAQSAPNDPPPGNPPPNSNAGGNGNGNG